MLCKTPEVNVADSVLEDFIAFQARHPIELRVHLGTGDEVLNGTTNYRLPFEVFANPSVQEWDSVQSFKIYNNERHIRFQVTFPVFH